MNKIQGDKRTLRQNISISEDVNHQVNLCGPHHQRTRTQCSDESLVATYFTFVALLYCMAITASHCKAYVYITVFRVIF
jgi:hypothetical protein